MAAGGHGLNNQGKVVVGVAHQGEGQAEGTVAVHSFRRVGVEAEDVRDGYGVTADLYLRLGRARTAEDVAVGALVPERARGALCAGEDARQLAQSHPEDAVPEPARVGGEVQVLASEVAEAINRDGEEG